MISVGKPHIRIDSYAKVTGKALFASDLNLPNMLYAKVIRSPVAHGIIKNINFSEALKLEGVEATVTAKDIPGENLVPLVLPDQPLLPEKVTKFYGEPLALIAATDPYIAEKAARLTKIEIEELPHVLDPLEAREHKSIHIYKDDNIFVHHKVNKGNIEEGFKNADIIIENVFRTPYQEHAYLETQGMVAIPVDGNKIEIFGSMQCPFYVQQAVSTVLGYSLNKVRVIQSATGGGFGGKEDVPSIVASQAALLAIKTGRPVKLIYDREEDIIAMSKRHPGYVKIKTGVKKDGTLIATQVEYVIDAGAYSTLSTVVLWRGTVHAIGSYECPNVKVDAYAVATNKVPCGAYRGFGSPQVLFAAESQMDIVAKALKISPVEIREKNMLKEGSKTITDQVLSYSVGSVEAFNKAIEKSDYKKKHQSYSNPQSGNKRKGIGISTIYYGVGLGAGGKYLAKAGSYVQLLHDGSVQVAVGTTEMGQGMHTVLAQIAAEEFQIPYQNVEMMQVDTSRVPDSGPTVASRATTMSGNAIIDACKTIKKSLFSAIAQKMSINADDLFLNDGFVYNQTDRSFKLPIQEGINIAFTEKFPLSSHGYAVSPPTSFDPETGQGDAYMVYSFATNVAEVEVDLDTYTVKVIKITAAHDVGKAINPQQVEGQIQGGSLQGMGYAVMEEILHNSDGKMLNPNLSTYLIPTSLDAPIIDPVIVEHAFPKGPYGAKGFGEQPLMGIAPAVANAVSQAIGKDIHEIPLTPERLYNLLNDKQTK